MLQQRHQEDEAVYNRVMPAVRQATSAEAQASEAANAGAHTTAVGSTASPETVFIDQTTTDQTTTDQTTTDQTTIGPTITDDTAVETVERWLDYVEIHRARGIDGASAAIAALIIFPHLIQMTSLLGHSEIGWTTLLWWLISPAIPLALLVKINSLYRQNALERAENALPAARTVAWIRPLIEALNARNRQVREAAQRMLPQLLLQLRPRHSGLLTAQQWEILGQRLRDNADRDVELNLATLKAVERMGDDAMLPFVEGAASSSGWTPATWRVRRAARECLPLLDARLQTAETAAGSNTAAPVAISMEQIIAEQRSVNPELARLLAELDEQRRGQGQPGMRLGFMLAAYMTILPATAWKTAESIFAGDWLACGLWGTAVLATTQLHRFSLFPRHRDLMRKLADYDDVAGVGALAETLEWPDRRVQDMAARALIRLLPRLRASDGRLLSQAQRGCLYRMLSMRHVGRDATLVLAILQALQQVGDEAAIPVVQRLARSTALTPTQRKVRQAAEDCLPYLRNSADIQRASQTLLRASARENVASDALLRPAYTTTATEPTELLRAIAVIPAE